MDQSKIIAWANPGPTGHAAFAMVTCILCLSFAGVIPKDNMPMFFAITLAGAIAQVIAGLIELKNGDESGGNLMFTMGCMFMLAPGVSALMGALKIATPQPIGGVVTIMLAVYQAIYGINMIYKPWFVFIMAPVGVLTLTQIGLIDFGYTFLRPTCALGCGFLSFWALYMVAHRIGATVGVNIPVGNPLLVPVSAKMPKKLALIADGKRAVSPGGLPAMR